MEFIRINNFVILKDDIKAIFEDTKCVSIITSKERLNISVNSKEAAKEIIDELCNYVLDVTFSVKERNDE